MERRCTKIMRNDFMRGVSFDKKPFPQSIKAGFNPGPKRITPIKPEVILFYSSLRLQAVLFHDALNHFIPCFHDFH
jgi:hypothetical protein